MSQSKGFTLVELIFTLSIILTLSFLTLPVMHIQSLNYNLEDIQYHISSIINSAKSYALTSHQKVDLLFTTYSLSFLKADKKIQYILPENCSFSHLKEVYFNKNGNINQANHIILQVKNQKIKLVFHLGNGDYDFES